MATNTELDSTDFAILGQLQDDSALSNQDLAAKVHISPATCLRRVKRLRDAGLIEREIAVLNPQRLAEALGHGLENAARYSPSGSEIAVSAAVSDTAVFLRVADRGPGVAPSDRDRVFERFVRLPSTPAVAGTGLGLWIARSLVEMNGGRLTLADSPTGGTLFEIELPAVAG